MQKNRILVAPLNWGLGHATRCIPVINTLLEKGYEPIIASDGVALQLLKKEFEFLKFYQLPSYRVHYAKKGAFFKFKIVLQSFQIFKSIQQEKKLTQEICKKEQISAIISDNRLGVRQKHLKSIIITHQLNVLSGLTTKISSQLHQHYIKKFDNCWVPDVSFSPSLSGKLGHLKRSRFKINYIGPISRFEKKDEKVLYDLAVVLSGPEPQRTLLENKLLKELKSYPGKIAFVRGVVEDCLQKEVKGNFEIYNFLTGKDLEKIINQSQLILSRSGYTTVMDLAKLRKKAFFIPTPGQTEQEYLAERFHERKIAPTCKQSQFKVEMLNDVNNYSGFDYYLHLEEDLSRFFYTLERK
ncbi:glycosyltransferase [Mesonia sp. K7]|uniref:glycosyltransferase n=1 Tax=Mesonia sp. K7 TaxID=2218606 RepID=UPI000DA9AD7B|nr:glycosyltransferase [Mesonia sp. K7]PZD77728.1 glycosyltransferase [Mesonia sp. K7]